jgi:hypothetical protein
MMVLMGVMVLAGKPDSVAWRRINSSLGAMQTQRLSDCDGMPESIYIATSIAMTEGIACRGRDCM